MPTKTTIKIDRDACIGCGQCANACPQSVIEMRDGKAEVVRELQCDGLGVCIGECPVDAIRFIEKEVEETTPTPAGPPSAPPAGGCPSLRNRLFAETAAPPAATTPNETAATETIPSALAHWPVQLHLIRPDAPQYSRADILVAATCTAFSMGDFHAKLLKDRSLIVACPKLDRQDGYREKLVALFRDAAPRRVTVARMEVPCCTGLTRLVADARAEAKSAIPVEEVTLTLQGAIRDQREIPAQGASSA